jgi:hypothetical protein
LLLQTSGLLFYAALAYAAAAAAAGAGSAAAVGLLLLSTGSLPVLQEPVQFS